MIMKKTFYTSGSQVQETAAKMNQLIRDYLIETGLFSLRSAEEGNGGYPKYTLKYRDSGYLLVLQSQNSTYRGNCNIQMGMLRGSLDETTVDRTVSYGSVANAKLTIQLLVHKDSMVFKVINAAGSVAFGGSCIRYTEYSGKAGYLYNSNETNSLLGYVGRYEIEPGGIAQLSYFDYSTAECAIVQNHPVIHYKGAAIGYANDLAIINGSHLSDHAGFSCLILGDVQYHGGRIPYSSFRLDLSRYAAAAMKNE